VLVLVLLLLLLLLLRLLHLMERLLLTCSLVLRAGSQLDWILRLAQLVLILVLQILQMLGLL
jgi:hypothetical protein